MLVLDDVEQDLSSAEEDKGVDWQLTGRDGSRPAEVTWTLGYAVGPVQMAADPRGIQCGRGANRSHCMVAEHGSEPRLCRGPVFESEVKKWKRIVAKTRRRCYSEIEKVEETLKRKIEKMKEEEKRKKELWHLEKSEERRYSKKGQRNSSDAEIQKPAKETPTHAATATTLPPNLTKEERAAWYEERREKKAERRRQYQMTHGIRGPPGLEPLEKEEYSSSSRGNERKESNDSALPDGLQMEPCSQRRQGDPGPSGRKEDGRVKRTVKQERRSRNRRNKREREKRLAAYLIDTDKEATKKREEEEEKRWTRNMSIEAWERDEAQRFCDKLKRIEDTREKEAHHEKVRREIQQREERYLREAQEKLDQELGKLPEDIAAEECREEREKEEREARENLERKERRKETRKKELRRYEAEMKRKEKEEDEERELGITQQDILDACNRTGLHRDAQKKEIWEQSRRWDIPEDYLTRGTSQDNVTRKSLMNRFASWIRGLPPTEEEERREERRVGWEKELKEERELIQDLMDRTYTGRVSRDRQGQAPGRLEVVQVWRIKHAENQDEYRKEVEQTERRRKRESIDEFRTDVLTMEVVPYMFPKIQEWTGQEDRNGPLGQHEVFLYHGTAQRNLDGIVQEFIKAGGGKETLQGGKQLDGNDGTWLFGKAVYLSEDSTKADEYANDGDEEDDHYMVICRAHVGRATGGQEPGDYQEAVKQGDYDCWIGHRKFREFVFYEERKVIPYWIVKYKRRTLDNRSPGEQENFHLMRALKAAREDKEERAKTIQEIKEEAKRSTGHRLQHSRDRIDMLIQEMDIIAAQIGDMEQERIDNLLQLQ